MGKPSKKSPYSVDSAPGRPMKRIVAIAALLLPLQLSAGHPAATVPDRFVGRWAGSPGACDAHIDDLILRIAHHRIAYWESEGPIEAVVVRGDEIALISELSGEGETWLATAKFTLSADGDRLIDRTSAPGRELVRHRCESASGAWLGKPSTAMPLRGAA
ncbi:hypothetical protein QFW77_01665 [Luteimonas sp. RD2P54]|uniref:DUF2147 domain-containing protein n=1 Tax=Luteimonas endophytica TaxID=3042023 RepID=A0ABT6J4F6_9GAMM|nr:hypothetical protein [Luteimonas endophytica]MDH5821703.1 hypothetical protein [Luteimonas endophytica]